MRLTNPRLASIARRGVRQMRSVRALFGLSLRRRTEVRDLHDGNNLGDEPWRDVAR
jgi:hypothetical protein